MGHIPGTWSPPQWMHLFLMLENLWSTGICCDLCGVWGVSFLLPLSGHFTGKCPFCLHLEQYGGCGQLCFKWPASPQFQQIGPDFSFDVEVKDDVDKVCLTPCPFLLLDLVSCKDGEAVLFTK